MCGRYSLSTDPQTIADFFGLDDPPRIEPRYNIAPSQPIASIYLPNADASRQLAFFQWGLVPFWAKDPSIGQRMINARSESAARKPAYRAAMRYRRCIVPATGFYEWQKRGSRKQPLFITLHDEPLMGLAGLWETWQSPDGSELDTCTILTCQPNDFMAQIHNRMPVILPREQYDAWLDPQMQDGGQAADLLQPYPADAMAAFEVSSRVNSPKNDDPSLIESTGLFTARGDDSEAAPGLFDQ